MTNTLKVEPSPRTRSETKTKSKKKPQKIAKAKRSPLSIPPYHVVLLDDDDHSYEYVIQMLAQLFGHSLETAFRMAVEVDSMGRVIVYTTHKEQAELKRDQIESYGADPAIPRCKGSMSALIEAAT